MAIWLDPYDSERDRAFSELVEAANLENVREYLDQSETRPGLLGIEIIRPLRR
ncbi:hypothetical protein MJO28_001465 [Puccinia striiformis f. sp. tritici]|uniref:Uncharacterized protein n=4 Tax=Puccinia striiformis TaxID=27350 RepID=A0A2S4WCH8_9BASI|nr:hypothetical protein Pst134EB_004328 [Puccinia striiformis f. sp. tritici]KAI9620579.1 hypothetical protein KEM48_008116 [Puccinia striiformis f. sp. tritici PST-130]KNF01736.1 hypothetical protein PSTG_05163 [Puccinia striiformis f. sp. tritici PST-78]POW02829.1 hypothetical protein PSHT_11962 [Puccinia striiformis]KAI7960976.1 hypothetical protein MJO28_001465 [Puccinia striiformis f. sp. tritici]